MHPSDSFTSHFVMGTAAGVAAEFLLFTLESRSQPGIWNELPPDLRPKPRFSWLPIARTPDGSIAIANRTLDRAMYRRELLKVATKNAPVSGLLFAGYELVRPALGEYIEKKLTGRSDRVSRLLQHTASIALLSGLITQTLEAVVWQPVVNVREAYEHRTNLSDRVPAVTRSLVQQEGPLSLWRGVGGTAASAAPFLGLYFAFSDLLSRRYARWQNLSSPADISFGGSALVGGVSAAIAVAITTPLEWVRRQCITQWGRRRELFSKWQHEGLGGAARYAREEAVHAIHSQILSVAPRSAVKRATYGFVKGLAKTFVRAAARRGR